MVSLNLGQIASVFAPIAKVASAAPIPEAKIASAIVLQQDRQYQKSQAIDAYRRQQEMDLSAFGGAGRTIVPTSTPNTLGAQSSLGSLRGFFSDLGGIARDIAPVVQLTRGQTPSQRSQPAQTVQQVGGQESSTSGSVADFANLLQPALFGRNAVKRGLDMLGGAGVAEGLSAFSDFMSDRPMPKRITRKMKSELMRIYNLSGMNIDMTAEIGSQLLNIPLSRDDVFMILTKKFRNDGSYVTKAAVRNARKTARKLDSLVMLRNELCPPTTSRTTRSTRTTRTTRRK